MSDADFDVLTGGSTARINVMNAAGTSPDAAAQADRAAAVLGLPPQTAQRNPAQVAQRQAAASAADAHPDVVSWLAQDPQNAAVSHDSLGPLSGVAGLVGRAWADLAGGVASGTASAVGGLGATGDALDRLIHGGRLSTGSSAELVRPFVGFARQTAQAYQRRVANPNIADQAVGMVGQIVPALLAQEAAPAAFAFQGAGSGAEQNEAAGKADTQAGDLNVLGNATVQGVLGAIPVARIAEGVIPELGHAALTALAKFGVGTAASAAQGAAMSVGGAAVTRATVDPKKSLAEGLGDTAGQMAILHAITRLPGTIGEVRAAMRPAGDPSALNAAADALHASPMPARAPERTADLAGQMTQGRSVFVPAEAVNSFLQSAKPEDAQAFLDSTGVEPQLESATSAGAKVVIPADAYMMSKPAVDALRDHISLSQDGLSAAEAQASAEGAPEALAQVGDQVTSAAREDAARSEPQQRVYADVRQQMRDIGLRGPEADSIAAITAARYATRAERWNDAGRDTRSPAEPDPTDAWQEYQRAATGGGLAFASGEGAPVGRSLDQTERGRIDLPESGRAIIRAFSSRDKSTIPHELGHAWLEELRADAARPDAPESIAADWATVRDHLGIGGGDIHTEAHEKFAEGFERYLMEGKAPSQALRGVFQRFKDWLTRIYANLSGLGMGTEPIRGVYDRLLATDREIAHAQTAQNYEPLTQADSGMTAAEHAAYREAVAEAKSSAREKLLSKAMKELRRTRTKEWADERARVRADVAAEVADRPGVRAWNLLLTGTDDGPVALRRADVEDAIGADRLSELPRSRTAIYTDNGEHPDTVAADTGHDSGEGMLRELIDMQAQRRQAQVSAADFERWLTDDETDRQMELKHGGVFDDLEGEALDAIHDDAREKVLQIEHRALERQAGERVGPFTTEALKAYADGEVGRLRTKDVNPGVYLRAERKAGREAQRALLSGDKVEALGAKRRQLMAFHMYRAAQDAEHELGVMQRKFRRYARKDVYASMAQPYFDQIGALLHRFGLRPLEVKNETPPLNEWLERREGEGETIPASAALRSPFYAKQFPDMTMEDARDLNDTVSSIAYRGREDKRILVGKERADFDEVVEAARDAASDLKDRPHDPSADPRRDHLGGYLAEHTKPEFYIEWLDGRDENGNVNANGPWHKALLWGASDAAARATELKRAVSDKLHELMSDVPVASRRTWSRKVDHTLVDPNSPTGERMELTKANVMGIAFNLGSESNMTKLLEGMGWEEQPVRDLVNRTLLKEEWDFVQGSMDAINGLWPEIVKAERTLTGLEPEKVQPQAIETPHGTYPGGYWPLVRDPERSDLPNHLVTKKAADEFVAQFVSAATPKGHTKSRTEAAYPLLLSPHAIMFDHVNKVTTRIAYGEYLLSARKFINDSRIRETVRSKLGRAAYDQLMPWLQRQIGYRIMDPRALSGAEGFLRAARNHITTSRSAINSVVWFEHGSAFMQSFGRVGTRNMLEGMAGYFGTGGPFGPMRDYVYDRSPMMRERMHGVSRDIQAALDTFRGGAGLGARLEAKGVPFAEAIIDKPREFAHWPVSAINQYIVAMPTWIGAYKDALRRGYSEEEAIRYGDKMVRTTHSSGDPMNLAKIQDPGRGAQAEMWRLATMFYGFHNQQLQLIRDVGHRAATTKSVPAAADLAKKMWWLLLATPVVTAAATGKMNADPMHDVEVATDEAVRALWAGYVGVRDVANFLLDKAEGKPGDYQLSPAVKSATEAGKTTVDLTRMGRRALGDPNAKDPSRTWLQHLFNTAGDVTGMPLSQFGRSGQYLKDVATGQEHPDSALQFAHDVTVGPDHTTH